MKIKHLILLFFIFTGIESFGQSDIMAIPAPIETKPTLWGKQYVYKKQLISDPLALQIPLLEAKDPEISYEFLTFKNQRRTMRLISGISTVVALYSFIEANKVSNGFYWSVVGSTALVNIYLGSVNNKHLNRALNKYNALANQKVSLQLGANQNQFVWVPQVGVNYQF